MTYCLGMLCRAGAVFLSDSRTSAGMDNITMCSKMRIYERPGDRVICILSSGNLSLTQATIALIDEDLHLGGSDPGREQLTIGRLSTRRFVMLERKCGRWREEIAQRSKPTDSILIST